MADPALIQLILVALATSPVEELDQAGLAARIRQGDHDAFRSFYEAHHQSLFRFLRSKNIDSATTKDLIQQAFVYIWEHRDTIDPAKSLRAYLFKISYTRMLNHVRDHKKFDGSQPIPTKQTKHTPEDEARAKELNVAISAAIAAMPERRSQVFELCFMQQLTYKEVADALDLSVKTIENHMGLALRDMRKALQQYI
ncbi:sigma-70 family RNA polymerase sigma factor [Halalkalibaculum sp. DA3122]|uniref:sigma-70 family RNA polymerase sigma factor n=1 Tax=Halalkalibaculum sp. DA3122 TaxID=3373607 RepID=UPI003754E975